MKPQKISLTIIILCFFSIAILSSGCQTPYRPPPPTKPSGALTINSPASDYNKFTFSSNRTGECTVPCDGTTDPPDKAFGIKWSIESVGAPVINKTTAEGSSVSLSYKKLPYSNNDFGKKTVRAEVKSLTAEAAVEVQIYFPRDAYNNPDKTVPNWYYYWKQVRPANTTMKYVDSIYALIEGRQEAVYGMYNYPPDDFIEIYKLHGIYVGDPYYGYFINNVTGHSGLHAYID